MNIQEVRDILNRGAAIHNEGFNILQCIADLLNSGREPLAREMILRALEHRKEFADTELILDALVRETGLFPYANEENLSLADSIAYEYHRPSNMEEPLVFHREQAEVYRRLLDGESVILSAPTSFGKSRIIDAVIASGRFNNIAVIVPTIALIDETRRRLSTFSGSFKLITQVSQLPGSKNIFVFTAERANAYEDFPSLDFIVLDEFYKIGALSEDKQRTVALNQAFYKLVKGGAQFYMLGPCVKRIPRGFEERYRCVFYLTQFATVVSEEIPVPETADDVATLVGLCKGLNEPTLIFCKSPKRVNEVARALVEAGVGFHSGLSSAADWIAENFHPDWILREALRSGIGLHHGRLPRSLGQFVVRAFNDEKLRFLICTSTLIEGVNTKAKNVIILDNVIAREKYDYFTFNNIKGRSGRMFEHFIGRVFLFHSPPQEELPFVDFPLFTQGTDTPESILVQMDESDLNKDSKARVERFKHQDLLPLEILKRHSILEPDALLDLANAISQFPPSSARTLAWRGFPEYKQLEFCCELVWEHFVERPHASVFSGKQLALKTNRLRSSPDVKRRILDELTPGPYAAANADEAVERVLEFDRTWASFEFPRLFKALEDVQRFVLTKRAIQPGDYGRFINQVENLFRRPFQVPLEEYGLPLQLTDKIANRLREVGSIDEALERIKTLPSARLGLDEFERNLLEECKPYL
jgi:RAD3-like DEAD/DEAH box helicase/helicase-like protein